MHKKVPYILSLNDLSTQLIPMNHLSHLAQCFLFTPDHTDKLWVWFQHTKISVKYGIYMFLKKLDIYTLSCGHTCSISVYVNTMRSVKNIN